MSIVRRNDERKSFTKQFFDGDGELYMRQITNSVDELSGKGRLFNHVYIEPGRSLVGEAGITLYRVGSIKNIPGVRKYVCVDGGMTKQMIYHNDWGWRLGE